MGMLDDVVQGLPGDAVQRVFALQGESGLLAQLGVDGEFVAGAQDDDLFGERGDQSLSG